MDTGPDFFDQASSSFLEWFISLPGTTFHPSLAIKDLRDRNAGRGIIATSDIPPETDLFTIPRDAIISVETSDLAKKLPELFDHTASATNGDELEDQDEESSAASSDLPTSWLDLILILLHESLRHTSKWQPYLSILPSSPQDFNTLMFWTPSDLSTLQASAIPTKIGRDSADQIFRSRILPVVKQHADIFYGTNDPTVHLSDDTLITTCHIIGSLIMSYAFDLQPDEDDDSSDAASTTSQASNSNNDGWTEDRSKPPTMGMVPMADMLNADAEFNAHLSHGDDALTMTSLRTIHAGEEVLNYYGPLPNGELLRRYGYASAKHARYDVVELNWDLVKTCITEEATQLSTSEASSKQVKETLASIERDEDKEVTDGFIIDRESGDPTEEGLCPTEAKFTKFPEDLVDVVGEVIGGALLNVNKKSRMTDEERRKELKRRVLMTMRRIVEKRAAEYGTSIEQDEELLARQETVGRLRMAIEVRLEEKRLLREAGEWVEGMLRKYTDTSSARSESSRGATNGQPASKRQKRGR